MFSIHTLKTVVICVECFYFEDRKRKFLRNDYNHYARKRCRSPEDYNLNLRRGENIVRIRYYIPTLSRIITRPLYLHNQRRNDTEYSYSEWDSNPRFHCRSSFPVMFGCLKYGISFTRVLKSHSVVLA
jgi:hypothetical protein